MKQRRKTRVGLVAGGLGAYWPQFPELLPQLQASARRVAERFGEFDCEVVDVGFISDAQEGAAAAEKLRLADCDLIVGFLTTYMTASMLVPIAQRSGAPVLLLIMLDVEFESGAGVRRLPVSVDTAGGEGMTLEKAVSLDVVGALLVVRFVVKAQYRSVVGALPNPR